MQKMMLKTVRFLAIAMVLAVPVSAQVTVQVAPFRSVKLQDGGFVTIRHGATQRVNLLNGEQDCVSFTSSDESDLVIQKLKGRCSPGYKLEVEIITPSIAKIVAADGGLVKTGEGFPEQKDIRVVVSHGGSVDIRTIPADNVVALISQGGLILAMPRLNLFARVSNGGAVHYWGDPRVESSVQHGGSVSKGVPPEASKIFSQF